MFLPRLTVPDHILLTGQKILLLTLLKRTNFYYLKHLNNKVLQNLLYQPPVISENPFSVLTLIVELSSI